MCNLALAMVLFMFVSAGVALSGEENLMAMRGKPPEGAVAVNRIHSLRDGGEGGVAGRAPGYFGWRDRCVRGRILLSDGTVEWHGKTSFGMTPRFVARDEESNPGAFLGELRREVVQWGAGRESALP